MIMNDLEVDRIIDPEGTRQSQDCEMGKPCAKPASVWI